MANEERFNLVDRINNSKPIIMRCCGCEKTAPQIPLIPVGEQTFLLKTDNLKNKKYICGKDHYVGWHSYICTLCESVRYYKTTEQPEDELEYVCVWDDSL